MWDFNPRSREGSDLGIQIIRLCVLYFNPRSREGSDYCDLSRGNRQDYFNPRSREGSDHIHVCLRRYIKISIHAPAKGATFTSACIKSRGIISIHAPAKGATKEHGYNQTRIQFQSTLPRRERLIDASAIYFICYFNPRSREGSDSNIIQQISFSLYNTVYFVSNNIK